MCEALLITVTEAARRLGLGRSLTYRFIHTGELPSLKIGAARRVAVVDLGAFVQRLKDDSAGE